MSRRNGARVRVGEGIYQDKYGLSAKIKVGDRPIEKRFPFGTALETIEAWRLRTRAELLEAPLEGDPPRARRGSLAGDVPRFLATLPEGSRKTDFALILKQWCATPLGALPRGQITRPEVLRELATWEEAGASASTLNHRVRALRELYRALEGVDTQGHYRPNPTDGIKRRPGPRPEPRGIPIEFVELILAQMPDRGQAIRDQKRGTASHTKIRLRVEAYTGLPHKQLIALEPRDLDLARGLLQLHPRRKGRGVAGKPVRLLPPAIAALTDFAAAGLFGVPFSRSSVRKSWHRAIDNAIKALAKEAADQKPGAEARLELFLKTIPKDCRPYDLRHAFLTEAYRTSGDLGAVAELGQHANIQTTRRYTEGAVSERAAAAIAKMAERYAQAAPPTPPPPATRARRGLRLVGPA